MQAVGGRAWSKEELASSRAALPRLARVNETSAARDGRDAIRVRQKRKDEDGIEPVLLNLPDGTPSNPQQIDQDTKRHRSNSLFMF